MAYYALFAIFVFVFMVEAIVTSTVLMHHEAVGERMSVWMKWWAIGSLSMISCTNVLGLMWLTHNHNVISGGVIDRGNWIQAIFAISTASLFIWVLVFHAQFVTKPKAKA